MSLLPSARGLSLMGALLLSCSALAEEALVAKPDAPSSVRNYANLRIGPTSASRRPALCLDVSPLEWLSAEACGTGSGFLHHDPAPETAHFRMHLLLHKHTTRYGDLQLRLGAGFGEIQIGEDDPGFQFGGVGPRGIETAGPEAGLMLRHMLPIAGGFEMVGQADVNLLYAPHSPKLVRPMPALQPSLSVSIGVGF